MINPFNLLRIFDIFHTETYMYQYPFSKEQLSSDLESYFVNSTWYSFNIHDELYAQNKFALSYRRRGSSKIIAKVKTTENGLSIFMDINLSTFFYLILSLVILFLYFFGKITINDLLPILIGIGIFIMIDHYIKKELKKDFEERLGLQASDEAIERKFKWF